MLTTNNTAQNSKGGSQVEKIYKTLGITGAASIAIGIVVIVIGVAAGILSIVTGAKLINSKKGMMF